MGPTASARTKTFKRRSHLSKYNSSDQCSPGAPSLADFRLGYVRGCQHWLFLYVTNRHGSRHSQVGRAQDVATCRR